MISVILDASVLCGDYFFRTPDARILRDAIGKAVRGIYIPQVALWEAINKSREEAVAAVGHHQKYARELARISQERQRSPDPGEISHRYFEFINALTKSPGFDVLAIPNVSQDELVLRALQRRKPFAVDGRGHRDALIWYAVLDFAEAHGDEVAFVTRNTVDFAQNEELHPDLVEDIEHRRLDPGRIHLFTDLKQFNSVKILPLLAPHDRIKGELIRGTLEGFNLKQWFAENHRQVLVPGDIMLLDFDANPEGFDAKFTTTPDLVFVNPTETRVLNSGDFFALVEGKVRVRIHVVSDMNAFIEHSWLTAFWDRHGGSRPKYGDYSMDHESEVSVELAIVLEKETHRLLSAEQLSATGSARSARLQPPHPIESGA